MSKWYKFKQQKLAYFSFIILCLICIITIPLNLISNDKPLIVFYKHQFYFPLIFDYSEQTFGSTLAGPADYLDPYIYKNITQNGNFAIYPLNKYGANTINYFTPSPNPAPPNIQNILGTDDTGRDMLARLLYSFRLSLWFGIALAIINLFIGTILGAIQGYYAKKVDLWIQRFLEIWGNIPEIYLLIIIASIFTPNIFLLLILFSLFSWLGTSEYIRLECLKIRQLDFITAAKITGLSNRKIIIKHVIPNVITPLITLFPFKITQGIVVLTALDFLGLGLPQTTPSMGALLSQAKANLEAWWITIPSVLVITILVLLLTFIGDGLTKAFNVYKS